MKQTNLIKQTPIISQPDEDLFEHLVEHIDFLSDMEKSDVFRRLEVDSIPEY